MTLDDDFNDFFLHLPPDPEEAFVVYEKRCSDDYEEETSSEYNGWGPQRRYTDKILAFDEVYSLSLFTAWPEPPASDNSFGEFFYPFKRAVEKASLKFKLERSRRVASSAEAILVLDQNSRTAIHKLIDAVREELSKLQMSESKRSSLFNKLNAFAREVDQNLSRTESFMRFAVEIGRMSKDAASNLEPVMERVDRILDILERAQSWVEQLPPWSKRKEIEPPPKQIEGPASDTSVDEDIPF